MSEQAGVAQVVAVEVKNGDVLLTKSGFFPVDQVRVKETEVEFWNAKHGSLRGNLDSVVTVVVDVRQIRFFFDEVS